MTAFSEDFRPLSKGFRRFSKIAPKDRRTFPKIFWKFPIIADDFRGRPEDVSIGDKLDISEIIHIITSEDMENTPLESPDVVSYEFYEGFIL